jgi:acyl-CoA reductase-like NAD-dependent aldehyde dehydrogenase
MRIIPIPYPQPGETRSAELVAGTVYRAPSGHRRSGIGRGAFYEPTLITGDRHVSTIDTTEIFGPVAAVVVEFLEERYLAVAHVVSRQMPIRRR